MALYSCGAGGNACPSQAELDAMRQFFETAPQTPGAATCNLPNKVVVARFDSMSTRFAMVAWDRVLLMDTWDTPSALAFAAQWVDAPQIPEPGTC
jgi:hypothetical protein